MARIAKSDVHAALQRAANQIIDAGGDDKRISRDDIKGKLVELAGSEKKLVDIFFRFIDHRDHEPGSTVTAKDVDKAVAYAKEKMIDKYDLNNNGLSQSEISEMSLTGQFSVQLARELKKAAADPGHVELPPPTGDLKPTNQALPLTGTMQSVIHKADEGLSLNVINRDFNPLKAEIGEFKKPSEMYQGKALIPVQELVGGALKAQIADQVAQAGVPAEQMEAAVGQKLAEFQPLLGALSKSALLKSPAHQFNVDGEIGNRVAYYGELMGHSSIDEIVHELGQRGMRTFKVMSHINREGQGGSLESILQDGVLGVTHTGGFSAGVKGQKKLSIKSDWPSDYGRLDDSHKSYNAIMLGVDYQAGTKLQVPAGFIQQYKHNADMLDVAAGMTVPFASQDPDQRHTSYKFNPLDVYDDLSATTLAQSLSKLDWDQMKLDGHGAFYCAEGQYCVACMGPKEGAMLKKSQFGDSKLGQLINAYQRAAKKLEKNPADAWQLLAEGKVIDEAEYQANKDKPISIKEWPQASWLQLAKQDTITHQQYTHLANTDRTATYMEWVPESVQGWEIYEPIEPEGLVATPMTVATMVWSLIRSVMPREEIAKTVAQDLAKAYMTGDATVKAQVQGVLGGHTPDSPEGQQALGVLGMKAASGLLLNILSKPEFREKMLQKSGYQEVTDRVRPDPENPGQTISDKALMERTFDKFVSALKDPALAADQTLLDQRIMEIDRQFRDLDIEREVWDPVNQTHTNKVIGPMLFAAPNSMLFYGQHPELHNSQTLRYVTNLQHAEQALAG